MSDPGHGYVTDIPYTRYFYRELAPAWLDFTATLSAIAPPVHGGDFTWCELGCGQGVTTVVLAATHPGGRFTGIDLMPDHIDHACRLAGDAGVTNADFHALDFADAADAMPPALQFDYIVAHGVYSWVAPETQRAMLRFIAQRLRPGGLCYVSYNAMPGRAADLPFQRLVLALGRDLPGDAAARFRAAGTMVRKLVAAGAASLTASAFAANLDKVEAELPLAYLAHEYMNACWQPLFVTEIRETMAGIGLTPSGSAVILDNFNSFALRRAEREVIAAIDDPDLCELCRDYLTDKSFRRDVFSRDGADLDDDDRRSRLLAMRYALAAPADQIDYSRQTGAGQLSFDNPTARRIVATLAAGPTSGGSLARGGIAEGDVLANLLALCSADCVRPVAPHDTDVTRLNRALRQGVGTEAEIPFLALSCGTALRLAAER